MNAEAFDPAVIRSVCIIDDDPAMLRLFGLLTLAGLDAHCFDSAATFLEIRKSFKFGCALVNIDMPAMSGIELVKTLREDSASPLIIAVTGGDSVEAFREALRTGAWDFAAKQVDNANLIVRVERALTVYRQHCLELQETFEFAQRLENLTERERFVVCRIAEGQKIKQIAKSMGIGFRTVSKHGIRALEKLRIDNDVQLAIKVNSLRRQRLIQPSLPEGIDSQLRGPTQRLDST
jgi:two-component system response regulator DctR